MFSAPPPPRSEEIEFLLLCCDTNHEGNIDYPEFTGRFLDPAKEIGFNLAVLLTNLSEHMPNDPRLAKFLETAGTVLNYFEPFLGRIEIKTADKIERVYFEIDENNIEQWEKPQIKESKRTFFYATITEGGDKEKLECFVDFCEDAIFEMQHAESLMSSDDSGGSKKVAAGPSLPDEDQPRSVQCGRDRRKKTSISFLTLANNCRIHAHSRKKYIFFFFLSIPEESSLR